MCPGDNKSSRDIWLVIVMADMLVMDLVVVEIVLNVCDSMRFKSSMII